MRTTLSIDDQLLRAAKKAAAESGRTLTAVVEDALRQGLARQNQPARASRVTLPTFDLGATLPGVDLDNSAALLDQMEEGHAAV
jgi:hypothetical protein